MGCRPAAAIEVQLLPKGSHGRIEVQGIIKIQKQEVAAARDVENREERRGVLDALRPIPC